eukprot:c21603_g1_i1.p1 GENE.c21603_g1_i1~~c21603_g1_i1.p1  ORF type:complete len:101 (-),score=28.58 c21603_g1_i1:35-304(-)
MSGWGFAAKKQAPPPPPQAQVLDEQEVTAFVDMLTALTGQCFEKCVPKFLENDLSRGELSCTDRCVAKYIEAQRKVGERLFQNAPQQQK